MKKKKKNQELTPSKPELWKRLLTFMANHPSEVLNYKDVAQRLQVHTVGMKRQISEVGIGGGFHGAVQVPAMRFVHHGHSGIDGEGGGLHHFG